MHHGLDETIGALAAIRAPTLLVPGNNEREDDLRAACEGWDAATVLHGDAVERDGLPFFGIGAGIPITPWDWSFDLDDEAAAGLLAALPEEAILITHSPPHGHVDVSSAGRHLGSSAVLKAIEAKQPRLVLCGHIHESWGQRSRIGGSEVVNLGPAGTWFEL